ncbi:MAG: phytoene/squalene synthase family protein [Rhodospirillales bacterium]
MRQGAALSESAHVVRAEDRDRFLCAMFAPPNRREALFGLYAFNLEIARIRESVSESLIGRMRLQWWRDALESIYAGTGPDHPVARALAAAVEAHGLTRSHFETLIEAREADMRNEPFETTDELIAYADGTSVPLMHLAVEILDVAAGESIDAAVRAAGRAWALTGLMRAIPFHRANGRTFLPEDLCRACGFTAVAFSHADPPAELKAVIEKICAMARQALREARAERHAVPRRAVPALLPATLAESYLNMLKKTGYDPFDSGVRRLRPAGLLRLTANGLTGRY